MKLLNKIKFHPLTLALFLVGVLTGYFKYLILIFLVVLIHESGHIFFAVIFKRRVCSITLLPFGGLTQIEAHISENIFEDLLIAVGGIFFQTILGLILYILNENGLVDANSYEFLNAYNIMIIIFNLVPICPLDGYKIIKLFTELFLPFKLTFLTSLVLSIFILLIFLITNINLIESNIFIFVFLFVMTFEEIKNRKYIVNSFYIERMNYEFSYPKKNISIKENMFKNRTNYISGKHEKIFLKDFFIPKE